MVNFAVKRAYIFDFDMTLADTKDGSVLCYKAAFDWCGGVYRNEDIDLYMSEFLDETYKRIEQPTKGLDDFISIFYVASELYIANKSRLYQDVGNTLINLKKKNALLAIVTNKDRKTLKQVLDNEKEIGYKFFDYIGCCDDVVNKKPHAEGLFKCMDALGVDAADCIYIGDSQKDLCFANNAGIKGILINRDRSGCSQENTISSLAELI